MVKFLALQVKMGKITTDDVPAQFKEKVKEELKKDGYHV